MAAVVIPALVSGVTTSSLRPPHWMTRSGRRAAIASTLGMKPRDSPPAMMSVGIFLVPGKKVPRIPSSMASLASGCMAISLSVPPSMATTVEAQGTGRTMTRCAGFSSLISRPVTSVTVSGSASAVAKAPAKMQAADKAIRAEPENVIAALPWINMRVILICIISKGPMGRQAICSDRPRRGRRIGRDGVIPLKYRASLGLTGRGWPL